MVKLRDKPKAKDKSSDCAIQLAQQLVSHTLETLPAGGAVSPQWIHEFRVSTKKLRALLQFYRPFGSKTALKHLDHKIAKLARAFSQERDRQVMQEITDQFVAEHENLNPLHVSELSRRLQAASQQQDSLETATASDEDSFNGAELAAELDAVMVDWQRLHDKASRIKLHEGIQFSYSKARKLAYEAESNDQDEAFHECRKWVKYLLYQLKLLLNKPRKADVQYVEQLEALGDTLGRFNDHCILEQRINQTVMASAEGDLEATALLMLAWTVALKRQDKAACNELFDRLFLQPDLPVHC